MSVAGCRPAPCDCTRLHQVYTGEVADAREQALLAGEVEVWVAYGIEGGKPVCGKPIRASAAYGIDSEIAYENRHPATPPPGLPARARAREGRTR